MSGPKKEVHGGKVKRCNEKTGDSWLDFSASINPFPPVTSWDFSSIDLSDYPDDGYERLKEVLGRQFRRHTDEIAVGNGSIELIRAFCLATIEKGGRYFIEPPTFGEYAYSAHILGGIPAEFPEDAAIRFICHPNNPTGRLCPRSRIDAGLNICEQKGTMLLVDEAFVELADPKASLVEYRHDRLFLVRSLTKSFSVPGVRFGYGFGSAEFIAQIEAVRPPWSVNVFAEALAIEAMHHYRDLERSRDYIRIERKALSEALTGLNLEVEPSDANYLLVHMPVPANLLCERLYPHRILVRDCSSFGLPSSIRVAVRTGDDNRQLIEAISQCLP